MSTSSSLWQPFELGRVELPHRLAMAPLTRSRAKPTARPARLQPPTTVSAPPSG
ncbi:hypothetical protein [Streptomyces mutabilis]|uniref:hypothetical protein n=1 Tax=Streptomyces mutabilis TaxID=67332 RepID=UPI0034DFEAC7